jgi:sRNA-binding carbon storage regulator CsrA
MLGKNQELAVCARLAFEAPRSVRIIRDNAVKWD